MKITIDRGKALTVFIERISGNNTNIHLPASIGIDIRVPEGLPDKYLNSLISVAELCKVKKTMINPPVFEIVTSKR